jgi:phosphonate transport system substrate-binding protein
MTRFRTIASLAGAITLSLAIAGCGSNSSSPSADSANDASPAAADVCPNGTLTFGVEPYEDASTLVPAYQALGKALGEKLDCKVDVQITQSYVAEILAMKNGKLDLGEFGPLGYVFARQQAGAVPLASFADKDGKLSTYTAGIWVPQDSSITSVSDLAGHTLALSEVGSTSGDALPREELKQAGIADQVKTEYAGGHPESQLALIHGKVDAAEINSQQLATSEKSGEFDPSQYRQIWKSAPIANDPIAVAPSLNPATQQAIKSALLSLPESSVAAIGKYLDFVSPTKPLVAVTNTTYRPLFLLASTLGLTTKDL